MNQRVHKSRSFIYQKHDEHFKISIENKQRINQIAVVKVFLEETYLIHKLLPVYQLPDL